MKNSVVLLLLLAANNAFATIMVAECQGEDFYTRTYADLNGKDPHMLEIYTPGGLGPNNLESSYLAKKSKLKRNPDNIRIDAEFPMDGRISIHNEVGSIRFPGADTKDHPLNACKYTFN